MWIVGGLVAPFVAGYVILFLLWLFFHVDLPAIQFFFGKIDNELMVIFALFQLLSLVGSIGCVFDNDKDNSYSKHSCDICGNKIKIGTGKHWPQTDGSCKCACEKCLPTVVEENL